MNASPHIFSNRFLDLVSVPSNLRLRVGEHVVDLGARRVVTRPETARLTSKAAAVLFELARHAGDTVTRDQLLNIVWKGRVTTPDVLTQAIKELRRAFGDDTRPLLYIETIPKVGYRLLAPVSEVDTAVAVRLVHSAQRLENDAANIEFSADDDARVPNARATVPPRHRRWIAAVAAVMILLGAVVAIAAINRQTLVNSVSGRAWKATNIRAITSDPGPERRPGLSPDGTRVAYTQLDPATNFERVVIRAVGQSQVIHLTTKATAHEERPMWSPDGTRIAFERDKFERGEHESCMMYVAASLGGAESEVGSCGNYNVNYFAWTPDGKSLVTSDQRASASGAGLPLALIDLDTGKKRLLQYQRSDSDEDLQAVYSPDGRWIAFRRGFNPHSDLYLMHAEGGAVRQLTRLNSRITGYTWTRDSSGLIFSSGPDGMAELFVVATDDGSINALNVAPAEYPNAALSADTVVYEIPRTKDMLVEVTVGEQVDSPKLVAPSTGSDADPAYSPDGEKFAFVSNRNGSQQVWLDPMDGTEPFAITEFRNASIWDIHWNADGNRLLATVRTGGKVGLVQVDLASRRQRDVAVSQSSLLTGNYGPDPGSYLLIRRAANSRGELLLLQNAGTAQEKVLPLASAVEHFELDPIRHMVYYARSDGNGVYRRDLVGGAEQLVTQKRWMNATDGWRLIDGRIWYVTGYMLKPFDLREFDPATGGDRPLAHVNALLRDVNFSVAPSHDHVLFATMGPEDIDIGAFDLVATGKN
ncbi:MAG: winged helix-turn-helix domain-containing protein [Rudaea sp.]|nr:winged helix-turn-helix domain-containing protein [Rudaea sp.]